MSQISISCHLAEVTYVNVGGDVLTGFFLGEGHWGVDVRRCRRVDVPTCGRAEVRRCGGWMQLCSGVQVFGCSGTLFFPIRFLHYICEYLRDLRDKFGRMWNANVFGLACRGTCSGVSSVQRIQVFGYVFLSLLVFAFDLRLSA